MVLTLGRTNEASPALTIGQQRADNLAPYVRTHIAVFVQHHAVKIQTA